MSYSGGSAGKDQKVFANILDYLERDHRHVFDLIDNLGLKSYLNARKGRGVTFLIPDEKAVKQLRGMADSDDDNKVADAVDLMLTHILPRLYEDASDMEAEKSDIGTALSRKLEIKEVKGDKVMTKSGAEISKDKKFVHNSRVGNSSRGGAAVWIVKGELEYKDAPVTENTYLDRVAKTAPKKGADENNDSVNSNVDAFDKLITYEDHCLLVCKVLNFWLSKPDTYATELSHARVLFGKNAMFNSFILLRVPAVFNSKSVADASSMGLSDKNKTHFEEFLNSDLPNAGLLATKSGKERFCEAMKRPLAIITETIPLKEKTLNIIELYDKIDSTNSLDGLSGLYPESLHAAFKKTKNLHMELDCLRYTLWFIYTNARDKQEINKYVKEAVLRTSNLLLDQETTPFIVSLSRRQIFDSKLDRDDHLDRFLDKGFLFCCHCCNVSGADEDDDSADLGIYMGANEIVFDAENAKSMGDEEYIFNPYVVAQLKKYIENGGDIQVLISST